MIVTDTRDDIIQVRDVFTHEESNYLINLFEADSSKKYNKSDTDTTSGNIPRSVAYGRSYTFIDMDQFPDVHAFLHQKLSVLIGKYCNIYEGVYDPQVVKDTGYMMVKYDKGVDLAQPHIDYPVVRHNNKSCTRIAGCVIYLNNIDVGGETVFYKNLPSETNKVEHIRHVQFKPEKGSCIIFPTGVTHPHSVEVSPSSDRYVLLTWFALEEDSV